MENQFNSIKLKKGEREHSVDLPDNDKKNTKNIGQFILGNNSFNNLLKLKVKNLVKVRLEKSY